MPPIGIPDTVIGIKMVIYRAILAISLWLSWSRSPWLGVQLHVDFRGPWWSWGTHPEVWWAASSLIDWQFFYHFNPFLTSVGHSQLILHRIKIHPFYSDAHRAVFFHTIAKAFDLAGNFKEKNDNSRKLTAFVTQKERNKGKIDHCYKTKTELEVHRI